MKPIKIYYIFQGWKDEETRNKFRGDFDFYEQEMQNRRIEPFVPAGLLIMRSENVSQEKYNNANGTPIGSKIEIQYLPETLNEDELEKFIENINCKLEKLS